uniref:MFS transporter n=1 Tax=Alcaligenes faecalis TaxID=511 RepID=UPI003CFC660B
MSSLKTTGTIPSAVYLLALSLFAMGSAEFLMGGILPMIAEDLRISLPTAGTLISAFAVGALIGGPPFAILALRWPSRSALFISQLAFIAATVVSLLAQGYWAILLARFGMGFAYACFWSVAAATAVQLSPPDRRAKALSIVVSGLTVAMFTTAAYMGTFGYIAALLMEVSGLSAEWLPAVLILFGVGAFIGLTIGGRTADAQPRGTLVAGIIGLIVSSAIIASFAASVWATVAMVFMLGLAGFLLNPAVWGRVYVLAPDAPMLAGATNASAFQAGLTLAPLLAGIPISLGYGVASVAWVGVIIAVVSLLLAGLDARLSRTAAHSR